MKVNNHTRNVLVMFCLKKLASVVFIVHPKLICEINTDFSIDKKIIYIYR